MTGSRAGIRWDWARVKPCGPPAGGTCGTGNGPAAAAARPTTPTGPNCGRRRNGGKGTGREPGNHPVAEIDRLTAQILDLTRQWPITRIRAQMREPYRKGVEKLTADGWWEVVALKHSEHHLECTKALRSREKLANPAWLPHVQARRSALWTPDQRLLWDPS